MPSWGRCRFQGAGGSSGRTGQAPEASRPPELLPKFAPVARTRVWSSRAGRARRPHLWGLHERRPACPDCDEHRPSVPFFTIVCSVRNQSASKPTPKLRAGPCPVLRRRPARRCPSGDPPGPRFVPSSAWPHCAAFPAPQPCAVMLVPTGRPAGTRARDTWVAVHFLGPPLHSMLAIETV